MIKIIFGVCLTLFILSYSNEMKQFAVETGMRGQVVEYLKVGEILVVQGL